MNLTLKVGRQKDRQSTATLHCEGPGREPTVIPGDVGCGERGPAGECRIPLPSIRIGGGHLRQCSR